MFALAIVLYALARTGSPLLAGWLAFAATAPGLAISPVAGALIDRVGSVWAITVDMTASAACVTALIAVDRLGWQGASAARSGKPVFADQSAEHGRGSARCFRASVPVTALARANAMDTAIHGLSDIAGPALAGAIVGFGGSALALGTSRSPTRLPRCASARSADRAADCHVWVRCCRRHAAECCVSCDSPRARPRGGLFALRSFMGHPGRRRAGVRGAPVCRRHGRSRRRPALGHALVSSVASRP